VKCNPVLTFVTRYGEAGNGCMSSGNPGNPVFLISHIEQKISIYIKKYSIYIRVCGFLWVTGLQLVFIRLARDIFKKIVGYIES